MALHQYLVPWILNSSGDDRSASQVPGHQSECASSTHQQGVDKWEESDFIFGTTHGKMPGVGGSSSHVESFSSFDSTVENVDDYKGSSLHALDDSVDGQDSQFEFDEDYEGERDERRVL